MPPFSRGSQYICSFCRYASTTSKSTPKASQPLPKASGAQAHAPKDNTRFFRGRIRDGSQAETADAPPQPARLPFALRYRARLAELTPTFLRRHPALRTFLLTMLATAPITLFVLLHLPFEFPTISGPSMSPTLNPNFTSNDVDGRDDRDRAVVQKWSPNDWRERNMRRVQLIEHGKYKRGQIVVYTGPHNPEIMVVKRIVGVPGDRVKPLKGYNGQDDPEPVVVQYNHLWVEGDINDRNKSWDSNWYGPISQNLVVGEVKAVYRPWRLWTIKRINYREHTWPAKEENRVVEGAVVSASINPDVVTSNDAWTNGKNEKVLNLITERPEFALKNFESSSKQRAQYRQFYLEALLVINGSEDKEKKVLAANIVRAMEDLFGKEALREGRTVVQASGKDGEKKKERWKPPTKDEQSGSVIQDNIKNPMYFTDANVHEDDVAKQREEKLRPAQAALKKMMEQSRSLADAKEKEIDQMDQIREARHGIASSFELRGIFSEGDEKGRSA